VLVRLVKMLPFVESPQSIMDQYLIGDEQVYFVDKPAPVTLLDWRMLAAFALAVFVIVRFSSPRAVAFGFFLILGVGAWLGVRSIRFRYTRYIVTSLRVMRMTGVFDRNYYWIPWQRVTDIAFEQTIIGRIFGFATLRIESANEESGLREMTDLNDPWKFQELVTQLVGRRQRYLNFGLSPTESALAADALDVAIWNE
jgi:membrane protein YdbS with pleckstrin-like domain